MPPRSPYSMLVRLSVLTLLLLTAPAFAQVPTLLDTIEAPDEPAVQTLDFGDTIEPLGDVNGDGVPDLAVGGYYAEQDGMIDVGRAYVIDGATGAVVHTLAPPNPTQQGRFGDYIANLGDLDGDDIADFVVTGAGDVIDEVDAGAAYVYSGATGTILYTLESPDPESLGSFGSAASAAGDLDGDGFEDFLLGALGEDVDAGNNGSGLVYVYSGVDGALIRTITPPFEFSTTSRSYFGREVYLVGDLDDDGLGDHAVFTRFEGQGRVDFFSAADGTPIDFIEGNYTSGSGELGQALITIPDLNADGVDELLIAAPGAEVYTQFPPFEAWGVIELFDGATRDLIRQFRPGAQPGGEPQGTGFSLALGLDLDGDGIRDFYAGSPGADDPAADLPFNNGRVYVFSTGEGTVLGQINSEDPSPIGVFGDALAMADLTGDGTAELLVGAPRENDVDGRIYVYEQDAEDAVFSVGPDALTYEVVVGAASEAQAVTLTNAGAGAGSFSVSSTVSPDGVALLVDPASGVVEPGAQQMISVVADATDAAPGTYTGTLTITTSDPAAPTFTVDVTITVLPGVANEQGAAPTAFALRPSYPNPFANRTTIAYDLAEAVAVRVVVHDVAGRRVATLVDEVQGAGRYTVEWDASALPGGVYVYRIEAGSFTQTLKAVLVR